MSKGSQYERLKNFFITRAIKMTEEDLNRCMRLPSEDDDSYIDRLRNGGFGGAYEANEQKKYMRNFLWIGGILALIYVISRVK